MKHTELGNRRLENRQLNTSLLTPVKCTVFFGESAVAVELINFHYRGASLKLAQKFPPLVGSSTLIQFMHGEKTIGDKIPFRITWETISENGMFGIEFKPMHQLNAYRENRFAVLPYNSPTVLARDPLDPNRLVYFQVLNISVTGLLLKTSFANKQLLPGMELRGAVIEVPGFGKADIDLYIANARPADDNQSLFYGVSIKDSSGNFKSMISGYLANLGLSDPDERISKLRESGLISKNLAGHLTFRQISTVEEYNEVLKLRFAGYRKVGKVSDNKTWRDMGEGLQSEGFVMGAYLGASLVGTVEIRFDFKHSLSISEKVDLNSIPLLKGRKLGEANRLVVHPGAHATDVVVGLLRKVHAIAMINGKPDGLLLAEDKLVALYEKIGAQKTDFSYPHPTKPNTKLHLMVIRRETYEEASGINPYAWSRVYKYTHQYLTEIGITTKPRLNPLRRVQYSITKLAFQISQLKKNNKISTKADSSQKGFLDPKWTEPHLHSSVLLPYILVAEDLIGPAKVAKILLAINFQKSYFRSASSWVSIAFFDYFIEEFEKVGGSVEILQLKAGYRNMSKDVLGVNAFLLVHALTPLYMFKLPEKWLPKFNKTRTWKVLDHGPQFVRFKLEVTDPKLIPKNSSAKINWEALFDAYVRTTTGRPARVRCLSSIFEGSDHCEYIIHWQNPFFSFKRIAIGVASLILIVFGSWIAASTNDYLSLSISSSLTVVAGLGFASFRFRQKYLSTINSLENFEKDADERYKELQSSKQIVESNYQEGKLIEKLNREIQQTEDLDSILNYSIKAICEQFSFERSFVMILDQEQKVLKTAAIYGNEADTEKKSVWQFKVDVSKVRDNPLLLSSCYFSGQSVVINDIEKHKYQLNESSKVIIDRLSVDSFAIVPIPSQGLCWGVLLADRGRADNQIVKSEITRRDLVILQRVAQIIGLALDKKAKLDSEFNLRKIFEKFVPSAIFQQINGKESARLGGETKELVCMFVDVRNFTMLSSTLAPQILVEKLNNLFKILHDCVHTHGGMIDKYLGDGALVTWGATPGSTANGQKALRAATLFLDKLRLYNLENPGLVLKVGLGLHKGTAIAGTIGSDDRMEFTVIGQAVNLAARLEQLTKQYECDLVVSEPLFEHLENDINQWQKHQSVNVRGVPEPIQIATFSLKGKQFDSSGDAA
jgi:class 3 adenylate cyclase